MGLSFHQTDCRHYKLLCIHRVKKLFQIHIYSSDVGKWEIYVQSFSLSCVSFNNGVYWNKRFIGLTFTVIHGTLINLDVQRLQKLSLQFIRAEPYYFGECGGHLHLVEGRHLHGLHLNVYEMNPDDDSIGMTKRWFVKYEVEPDELPLAYPEMHYSLDLYEFKVLDVVMNAEEEEAFMVVGILGKVIRFNLMDKSFKNI